MPDEIDKILSDGDKVLWRAQPVKTPWVISKTFGLGGQGTGSAALLVLLIPILTLLTALLFFSTSKTAAGKRAIPAFDVSTIVSYFLLLVGIILTLRLAFALLSYKVTAYAITNQRVISQSGIIGRDFKSVPFNSTTSPSLEVSWLGEKYGAGNIILGPAGVTYMKRGAMMAFNVLRWVPQPYEVMKILNKATKSAPVTRFIK